MKSKTLLCGLSIAAVLQLGVLAGSARADTYLYSGSETNVTLSPGTYIITAYGAQGGGYENALIGGVGAEMSAEFSFLAPTSLTLLVGGPGDLAATTANGNGGGGGGGSFVVQGSTPLVVAGGGGGGAFVSGIGNPRGGNGSITTSGSAGGGNNGGSGGLGGGGGGGGDPSLTGSSNFGQGAAGGGGFSTDGTGDRPVLSFSLPEGAGGAAVTSALTASAAVLQPGGGGLSFLDGGAGALSNLGGRFTGNGGFGGGGGGYCGSVFGFGGGGGGYSGGGAGGSSDQTTLDGAGGGGGSYIDSSAVAILAEVPGALAPSQAGRGEIIIAEVPEPASVGLLAVGALALLVRRRRNNVAAVKARAAMQDLRTAARYASCAHGVGRGEGRPGVVNVIQCLASGGLRLGRKTRLTTRI
jgi:hypothetical protein